MVFTGGRASQQWGRWPRGGSVCGVWSTALHSGGARALLRWGCQAGPASEKAGLAARSVPPCLLRWKQMAHLPLGGQKLVTGHAFVPPLPALDGLCWGTHHHRVSVGLTPSANWCSRQREFALLNNYLFFPLKSFFRNGTFVCLPVTQDLQKCLVLHELRAFPIDRRWCEVCLTPAGVLTCPFFLLGPDLVRFPSCSWPSLGSTVQGRPPAHTWSG